MIKLPRIFKPTPWNEMPSEQRNRIAQRVIRSTEIAPQTKKARQVTHFAFLILVALPTLSWANARYHICEQILMYVGIDVPCNLEASAPSSTTPSIKIRIASLQRGSRYE